MNLVLFLILTTFSSYASKMTAVRDACQHRDWQNTKCVFLEKSPHKNLNYQDNEYNSGVVDLGGMLGALTEQMDNINNPAQYCFGNQSNLSRLSRYTKQIVDRKPLSACQKACVVKCVTANYITYEHSNKTGINQDSACQAANSGKGVCRAFSNLADHLNDGLGLKSNSVSSNGHAYNRVQLNNRWYVSEPQDPECRFSKR